MSFPRSDYSASTIDSTATEWFEHIDQYIEHINGQINQLHYISADQIEFIRKQVIELIKLKAAAIKQKEVCDLVDADKDTNELLLSAYNHLKILIAEKVIYSESLLQALRENNNRLEQQISRTAALMPSVGFINENNNNASTFMVPNAIKIEATQDLNLPKRILFNEVKFKLDALRGVFFAHIVQDSLDAKKIYKFSEHKKMFTQNENLIELSVKDFLDYNRRTFGLENMVSLDERAQPFLYSDNPVINPSLPKQITFLQKDFSLSADGKYYYIFSSDLNDTRNLFHAVNKALDRFLKKRNQRDSNLKFTRNFASPFITFPVADYIAAKSAGKNWFVPVETPLDVSEAEMSFDKPSSGRTKASKDSRKKNTTSSSRTNVQKSLDEASDNSADVTQFQEGDSAGNPHPSFSTASSTTSIFRGFVGDNPEGTFLQDLQTTSSQFSESALGDFETELPIPEYETNVAQFQEVDSAGNSFPFFSTASSSTSVLDNNLGDLDNSFMQTLAASSGSGEISNPFDLNVSLLDADIDHFNVASSDASNDDFSDFVDASQLSPQVLFCQTTNQEHTQPQLEGDFETLKKRRFNN